MANKLKGNNRKAMLASMRSLKGELVAGRNAKKQILDRQACQENRVSHAIKWKYNPTDLVRCKTWQHGTFIATVISVESGMATLLGPMGAVIVPCESLSLMDRYDDPCETPDTIV
jgi:hypothetical protein